MADRLGLDRPGPVVVEEQAEAGESIRSLLSRVAGKFSNSSEALFDPETQTLSSEVTVLLNGHVDLPQGIDTKVQGGDRILFLPILAGG
jgi:molybdopterin converting factor small subunit